VSAVPDTPVIRHATRQQTEPYMRADPRVGKAIPSPAKGGDFILLEPYLPEKDARQTWSLVEAAQIVRERTAARGSCCILDLGCGAGQSYETLTGSDSRVQWIGLDIGDSMEVRNRAKLRQPLCTYDGVSIPMKSDCFDVVYSHQVFEHVRYPEKILSEAFRILRPDGFLIGSTSHLEPFHSRSYWNFTPYGFSILLEAAGFKNISVRPGIDGFTLMGRRLFSHLKMSWFFKSFFTKASPLNAAIELLRIFGVQEVRRNALKLTFCGHFIIQATNPSE